MYNIKDILSEEQKEILKKEKVNLDIVINNDTDMREFVHNIFLNVTSFKHIQDIADTIVEYHNHQDTK